jgi:methionyl-tRNA formyltransferase
MIPLRLIFAGSGEFGLPTLRALASAGHELVQIYSQPDRPAGRGRKMLPTPIAQAALDHSWPLVRTENINAETLPNADLMVVIAFGQKLSEPVTHHPRLGAINLHASLLPKHRGAAPINWSILSGDTVTGNSVIRMAQRMDAGAILGQSQTPIAPTETAGELHDRLSADGVELMLETIHRLANESAVELPQNESLATLAPKLSRTSTILDFSRPGADICRQIRGLYPWPGCRVRLLEATGKEIGRLTLATAQPITDRQGHPGEIDPSGRIGVGDGMIEILSCQPEGGRRMLLAEYRNGHPWPAGGRLESIA